MLRFGERGPATRTGNASESHDYETGGEDRCLGRIGRAYCGWWKGREVLSRESLLTGELKASADAELVKSFQRGKEVSAMPSERNLKCF